MADEKVPRLPSLRVPQGVKATPAELREVLKSIVLDPLYLQTLMRRAREGKLPPPVETFLLSHVFGKPVEQHEIKKAEVIKIIHEYADEPSSRQVIDVSPAPNKEIDERTSSEDALGHPSDTVPEKRD